MPRLEIKSNFYPPLVLVIICLVVTLALSLTYLVTKPVIDRNAKEDQIIAVKEVLPEGDDFTESKGTVPNVEKYFVAKNNSGVAILATSQSFGGLMKVIIGIDNNGTITKAKVVSHTDTPGLGTQPMEDDIMSQYIGHFELKESSIKKHDQIDAIAGATISSDAIYVAIKTALDQFEKLGGTSK